MTPGEVERIALWWGPGMLLLLVFGYGFLRLAHYWIGKTMDVKLRQSESAFGIARQYVEQFLGSQKSQAEALSRLATSVEHRDSHESFEHQEILIALKAMHRDIDTLYCRRADAPCTFRIPYGGSAELDRRRAPVKQEESGSGIRPPEDFVGSPTTRP